MLAGPLKFEAAIQVMAINAVPNILYFLIRSDYWLDDLGTAAGWLAGTGRVPNTR